MKKIIRSLILGVVLSILLLGGLFYLFLFLNPFNINEINQLKWVPVLITCLSIYPSGIVNAKTPLKYIPLLLLPLILFKPFNYTYFPFIVVLLTTGVLSLIVSRANQKNVYKNLAFLGLGGIFLIHLFCQPLILEKDNFGYDEHGEYINAVVLWDFSSEEALLLPNHTLLDKNGEAFHLNALSGKWSFITFWATWCKPCLDAKPELEKLKHQFRDDKRITFVDISFDTDHEKWKKYLNEAEPKGKQLIAENQQATCREFDFQGIPMYLIVEESGKYKKIRFFESAKNLIVKSLQ